jgi:hypothetical protein
MSTRGKGVMDVLCKKKIRVMTAVGQVTAFEISKEWTRNWSCGWLQQNDSKKNKHAYLETLNKAVCRGGGQEEGCIAVAARHM